MTSSIDLTADYDWENHEKKSEEEQKRFSEQMNKDASSMTHKAIMRNCAFVDDEAKDDL